MPARAAQRIARRVGTRAWTTRGSTVRRARALRVCNRATAGPAQARIDACANARSPPASWGLVAGRLPCECARGPSHAPRATLAARDHRHSARTGPYHANGQEDQHEVARRIDERREEHRASACSSHLEPRHRPSFGGGIAKTPFSVRGKRKKKNIWDSRGRHRGGMKVQGEGHDKPRRPGGDPLCSEKTNARPASRLCPHACPLPS